MRRITELKAQISVLHSHTNKPETRQNCVILIFEKDTESDFCCREMHFKWSALTVIF